MENNSFSSSSSSDSSTWSDYLVDVPKPRKVRRLQERIDMDYFDDEEFKRRFRFNKDTVLHLESILINFHGNEFKHENQRGNPLSPVQQIMLTLRYYATGCFQTVAGDLFGINQGTVCRIVHKVSRLIAQLRAIYIRMPSTTDEINASMAKFYNMKKIPRVIGIIDGTHILMKSPGGDNPELFRNRKGSFSINVQGICDSDGRFLNVISRWHGSAHDTTIFNFSQVKNEFLDGQYFFNSTRLKNVILGTNQKMAL